MYINYVLFIVICNCSHAVLPSIFAVPMREWLGEHSFTSSSFPIAVLGGAQRLCSWSFMYEYHHFTVWSTDESLIYISCNAYSINDRVQYVFCCSSSLFKCCSSVYFCCSLVIVSRCPSWYIYLCRFNILTGLYEIVTCVLSLACLLSCQLTLICPKNILCLLYGLVVMYSAVPILMLIFSLYLTSMNK